MRVCACTRSGIYVYMNLNRARLPVREGRIAHGAARADNRQAAAYRRAIIQGATTMGLFKSKRDIPDEEIPLADVPNTGDNTMMWSALAILAACGLVVLRASQKREEA